MFLFAKHAAEEKIGVRKGTGYFFIEGDVAVC